MSTFNCRRWMASLLFGFAALNSQATAFSTDQSDLWFIPSESGWGMQLVQRNSTIFSTLFVYGQNGQPTWYVSTMGSTGPNTWSGALYATTGPWFGTVPFNSQNVVATQVGSMTWTAQTVETGNVSYTVNGVNVSKNVTRETLVNDDFTGTFGGAFHGTATSCSSSSNNATSETYAAWVVSQSGLTITFALAFQNGSSCTFVGSLSQAGQFGEIVGNYTCSSGENGTFDMFEMNAGFNAMNARLLMSSTNAGCQTTAYLGGIRHR